MHADIHSYAYASTQNHIIYIYIHTYIHTYTQAHCDKLTEENEGLRSERGALETAARNSKLYIYIYTYIHTHRHTATS